jgi:hypothetical protein
MGRESEAKMKNPATVTRLDATNMALVRKTVVPHSMDLILLDAPCSGERHLLDNPAEMASWTPGRSKSNAQRQLQLLLSAAQLIRGGGRVVYSTCSISPLENDDVVDEFLAKLKKHFQRYNLSGVFNEAEPVVVGTSADEFTSPFLDQKCARCFNYPNPWDVLKPEKTRRGWMILPDANEISAGPMYVSVLDFVPSIRTLARQEASPQRSSLLQSLESSSEDESDNEESGEEKT